jgi:hypothetical protein
MRRSADCIAKPAVATAKATKVNRRGISDDGQRAGQT